MTARPMNRCSFSGMVKGSMASVGHTSPHRLQFWLHSPTLGVNTGVQIAPRPPSTIAGCKPLVGHTFMQAPQRTQRSVKSSSATDPGGRMRRLPVMRLSPSRVGRRARAEAAPSPQAVPTPTPARRRLRSRLSLGPGSGLPGDMRIASCGHSSAQDWHWMHSAVEVRFPFSPIASILHSSRQRVHSLHALPTLRRKKGTRAMRPSSAPSGQRLRHQNRRERNPPARMAPSRSAAANPLPYAACWSGKIPHDWSRPVPGSHWIARCRGAKNPSVRLRKVRAIGSSSQTSWDPSRALAATAPST